MVASLSANCEKDENGDHYRAVFEIKCFSEGTSRYAFKGILLGEGPRNRTACVSKVFKPQINLGLRYEARKCQEASFEARKWARLWNKYIAPYLNVGEPKEIDFVIPLLAEIPDCTLPQRHVTIEENLSGDYHKFNSNSGAENRQLSSILPAFGHWVWEASGRKIMICDIQGVIQVTLSGTRYYKLTDVAIHSLTTGEYGMTDLGMPGMVSVLLGHKCTNICHQIGLNHPLTSQNEQGIPKKMATTYQFELAAEILNQIKKKAILEQLLMLNLTN